MAEKFLGPTQYIALGLKIKVIIKNMIGMFLIVIGTMRILESILIYLQKNV